MADILYSFLKLKNIFVILLLTVISDVLGVWNTADYNKREHSLVKPYQGSGATIPNWNFHDSTIVTSNYVRLTPDQPSRSGDLWNTIPCQVKSWELQVQFKIHGSGKENLFGDGLVIWYTKDRDQPGPVFGSKDYFQGLAIFIDTYSNHNGPHNHAHPYISAMVNNGSLHYDHDRDGTHTEIAGCEAKLRNLDHETYINVRYEKDTLSVLTDLEGKHGWKPCFTVNGIKLPTGYYFGFSAATGQLSDNHDIIGVKLYELDTSDDPTAHEDRSNVIPAASYFAPPRDHIEDPKQSSMSGLKIFAIVLCGLIGVVVCIVVGVMIFQKNQTTSRKRFY